MLYDENEEQSKMVNQVDNQSMRTKECLKMPQISKRLLPYKAFYFFFNGSGGCIYSFLPVFFKQIGMSPFQVGVLNAVKPFISFIFSPLGGVLSDRFRIRKAVLLISLIVWIMGMLCIGLIPAPTELKDACPEGLPLPQNLSIHEKTYATTMYKSDIGWLYDKKWISSVFIIIAVCMSVAEVFYAPSCSIGDAAVISALEETDERHLYPQQRSWGALGMGVFQLGTAAIMQTTIEYRTICGIDLVFTKYQIGFYICVAVNVIVIIIATTFKFKYGPANLDKKGNDESSMAVKEAELDTSSGEKKHLAQDKNGYENTYEREEGHQFNLRKLAILLCSVHYMSWLLCTFYLGVSNGVVIGFLVWYLQLLGGDAILIGVIGGVDYGTEFLFYYLAPYFIRKFGAINILHISLIAYVIRFAVYASINNPWEALPAEVLQGFIYATLWPALIDHASKAVPSGSLASIMCLTYGVYWGLGLGTGSLLGGALVQLFGAKMTFIIFIGATLVVLCIFFIAQKLSRVPLYNKEGN